MKLSSFAVVFLLVAIASCATKSKHIDGKSFNSIIPIGITIASVKSTPTGVQINAYTLSTVVAVDFLKSLKNSGYENVQLTNLSSITECGRRFFRVEAQIPGDFIIGEIPITPEALISIATSQGVVVSCRLPS